MTAIFCYFGIQCTLNSTVYSGKYYFVKYNFFFPGNSIIVNSRFTHRRMDGKAEEGGVLHILFNTSKVSFTYVRDETQWLHNFFLVYFSVITKVLINNLMHYHKVLYDH